MSKTQEKDEKKEEKKTLFLLNRVKQKKVMNP